MKSDTELNTQIFTEEEQAQLRKLRGKVTELQVHIIDAQRNHTTEDFKTISSESLSKANISLNWMYRQLDALIKHDANDKQGFIKLIETLYNQVAGDAITLSPKEPEKTPPSEEGRVSDPLVGKTYYALSDINDALTELLIDGFIQHEQSMRPKSKPYKIMTLKDEQTAKKEQASTTQSVSRIDRIKSATKKCIDTLNKHGATFEVGVDGESIHSKLEAVANSPSGNYQAFANHVKALNHKMFSTNIEANKKADDTTHENHTAAEEAFWALFYMEKAVIKELASGFYEQRAKGQPTHETSEPTMKPLAKKDIFLQ